MKMMELVYLGHSAFRMRLPRGITLVTDPFEKLDSFLMRPVKAEVVTVSHQHHDHNSLARVKGNPLVISAPGEYEISGVRITGFPTFHDKEEGKKRGKNNVFLIKMDQIKICHLGDLGHVLSESVLEELNDIDVLLVPVGGVYTINFQEAVKLTKNIQPKIVIPMHYRVKGMEKVLKELEESEAFLKGLGAKERTGEKKLILKKGNLPEEMEVVLMERF